MSRRFKIIVKREKNSVESFVGSENSRTFAPAFAQITGSEQIEKEIFERFT